MEYLGKGVPFTSCPILAVEVRSEDVHHALSTGVVPPASGIGIRHGFNNDKRGGNRGGI